MKIVPVPVVVLSDPELVRGTLPSPVARGDPFGPA
jgi:hypothetical protein